jgi:signal peptidase I
LAAGTKNMNDTNKTYPKFVGVILGLLLEGSAHFLSGKRTAGIIWYFSLFIIPFAGLLILTLPGVIPFYLFILSILVVLVLWLIMLKQSFRPVRRIGILGWIAVIVLSFVLGSGSERMIDQAFDTFKVSTGAMSPTIISGDHLIVERLSYHFRKPKRGEIVVFSTSDIDHPAVKTDIYYMKRVVGMPGETIQIDPPSLIVNGEVVKAPTIFEELSFNLASGSALLSSSDDKIILGENQYLTLGDNTKEGMSLDGRYYGPISEDSIFGRVSHICWPFSRIGK